MSCNTDQSLAFVVLQQKIEKVMTPQLLAKIVQYYGLPRMISQPHEMWGKLRERGKFKTTHVWEFRQVMIDLNQTEPSNDLVTIIDLLGEYHNRYRNNQIEHDLVATIPFAKPAPIPSFGLPGCKFMSSYEHGLFFQQCCRPTVGGKDFCKECLNKIEGNSSKTSHYELPVPVAEPAFVPAPSSDVIPALIPRNPNPLVAGSHGLPYYKYKRNDEVVTEDKSRECRVCMTNEKYVALQPCGCVCLCGNCALVYKEKTCPNCREEVSHLQGLRSV